MRELREPFPIDEHKELDESTLHELVPVYEATPDFHDRLAIGERRPPVLQQVAAVIEERAERFRLVLRAEPDLWRCALETVVKV